MAKSKAVAAVGPVVSCEVKSDRDARKVSAHKNGGFLVILQGSSMHTFCATETEAEDRAVAMSETGGAVYIVPANAYTPAG